MPPFSFKLEKLSADDHREMRRQRVIAATRDIRRRRTMS
jgi:hypothetical protein